MKRWILIVCVLCLFAVALVFFPWGYFYTESYARKVATADFQRYCRESLIDPNDYNGPVKMEPGAAKWDYTWKSKDQKKVIGVWIDNFGWDELYSGDAN